MSRRNGAPPPVKGVVAKICGKVRPYVVTYPIDPPPDSNLTDETSITFSLSKWDGASKPKPGQVVELSDLNLLDRGWRANIASPVTNHSNQQ